MQLKSSTEEAEKEISMLETKGSEIQEQFATSINQTNLQFVANLQETMSGLCTTNQNYRSLLSNNEEAIREIGLEFQTLDQGIAGQMETDCS